MILASLLLGCPKPTPTAPTDTDLPTPPPTPATIVPPTPPSHTGATGETGLSGTGDTAVPVETGDTGPFAISCDPDDTGAGAIGVRDCNGRCYPEAYVGDGYVCDDGTPRPWGSPDFDCAQFGFDGGDCSTDTGP